ncbi:hypothetical protein R6Y95_06205 [Methanoculleus palmolei]|uniref:Uncharacterized protein n=1 Tax=Methanoculleus palmolei TaxID=72612 RepID=A0ABD8A7I0_9EURY|nr:hypothetical protein R6Y95_06205 [Methanoculleus palmolei]
MAIYNALFEAASKLKKGAGAAAGVAEGAAKSTRDAARATAVAAKQSETVKAAGPALGKIAKFAAYPAGLGGGIGLGTWAAGAGAASAIDATGTAVKKSWAPATVADAGKMLAGVVLLLVFLGALVYMYRKTKGA